MATSGAAGGIGVLGGTFNPVHIAHLRAAEEVREALGLEKVIFVPAGNPPLKAAPGLLPADKRLKMVRLAVRGNPRFEVSAMECRGGRAPSYTVDTLERFARKYGSDRLRFITGIDVFKGLHLWRRPWRLIELADFVVMSRPGHDFSGLMDSPFMARKKGAGDKGFSGRRLMEMAGACARKGEKGGTPRLELASGRALYLVRITDMDISAQGIRALLAAGRSARYLLPEPVLSFIITNGLEFSNG